MIKTHFPLLLLGLCICVCAQAKDINVFPGDSLAAVRDRAQSGDRIRLHGGTYPLTETLEFGPQNSGVTWMAAPGEQPVISGGVPITGWTPDRDGVWKAKLDRKEKLRQLYVNGLPAQMARLKRRVQARGGYGEFVIKGNEPWAFIPGRRIDGIRFLASEFPAVAHPADLELRNQTTWTMNRLCVRAMKTEGDQTVFLLEQPFAAIAQTQGWGTGFNFNGQQEVFNAREFLDAPGEFYFDRAEGILYYKPRLGEAMGQAQVVAPVLETLISIRGSNLQEHVAGLRFEGITFAHTAWQMVRVGDSHGACGIQSCALTVKYGSDNWHDDFYQTTDLPCAAVDANSADHLAFVRNVFKLTGAIGLNLENDVCDSVVEGNVFQNIGACAINIGHPQHVYIGKQNGANEGFGPYHIDNHRDKWDESVEGLCTKVSIDNNLIRHTGVEHPPSVALSVFYGHGITIAHNDIRFAPYSGISLGWGWEEWEGHNARSLGKPTLSLRDNAIRANKIGNMLQTLQDGGGIYLLGTQVPAAQDPAKQQWTDVSSNYLYDFGGDMRAGIHPDNGTHFYHFHHNVFNHKPWSLIKVSDFHKTDFIVESNFANTPLYWTETVLPVAPRTIFKDNIEVQGDNWPPVAQNIMQAAGLTPEFRNILKLIPGAER